MQAVKYGVILFLIAGICTGILGGINEVTTPIIEANNIKTQNDAMKALLSSAETFEEVTGIQDENILGVFMAKAGNQVVGYVAKVAPVGYGGEIGMLVAFNEKVEIAGIEILSSSETPGFGANASKPIFKDQYIGKVAPLAVSKAAAADNEIQAITGATITSDAVTLGVNNAAMYISEHLNEWGAN